MMRIALGIEYDGSQFHGWQRQNDVASVQEAVENALSQVADQPITTICAGRTDAGVHATGQVVHFDTPVFRSERAWVYGSNAFISPAVRVLWAKQVPQHFNARRSAISRRYRFVIYNHPIRPSLLQKQVNWHFRPLDITKMQQAANYWLGEHDFSAFRASECQSRTPIRRMENIQVVRIGDLVLIDIQGNAFLHHMVRNIAGVLMEIGGGFAEPIWAKTVLESRNRTEAGVTATPFGLYLVGVQYPEEFGIPTIDVGPWFLQINKESLSI